MRNRINWWDIVAFAPEGTGGGGGDGGAGDAGGSGDGGNPGDGGGSAPGGAPADGGSAPPPTTPKGITSFLKDETLKSHAGLKDFKSVDALAKSLLDTQKMLGMDRNQLVALPPEGADDETRANFYNRLGRPEQADGYQLEEFEMPEGFEFDEQMINGFKNAAHEAGLSQAQMSSIYNFYMSYMNQQFTTLNEHAQTQARTAEDSLRREWGQAFDDNLALAQRALKEYADEDTLDWLDSSQLGNDPRLVRIFAKMGKQLSEDGLLEGFTGSGRISPQDAQRQINAKMGDPEFGKAYYDKYHPNHANAVKEMEELYRVAYPGEAQ